MTGRRKGAAKDWRAILFDLDGTLADTVPLILHCYRHTMRVHLGTELPDELWIRHIGKPLRASMTAFAASPEETVRMVNTYVAVQRRVHDEMVRGFPKTPETLKALRARGVRLGVVTSKGREMTARTLGSCGLGDAFDVLVTADEVCIGKPHPEPVLRALADLGLEGVPGDVVFVGDSPHDLVAGHEAGVRTAAVLWGPFDRTALAENNPDYWITDWAALIALRP